MPITEGRVTAGDVDFAYLEAGSGPLALCLHGFPDSAWTWRHLLPELADAGFHAVAPFLRGYAPTAIPADGVLPDRRPRARRHRTCTRRSAVTATR